MENSYRNVSKMSAKSNNNDDDKNNNNNNNNSNHNNGSNVISEQQGSAKSAISANSNKNSNQLMPPGGGACWKSTPGASGQQPPRLSLSAILPLSAMCSAKPQQQSQKKRSKRSSSGISDRTMLPGANYRSASNGRKSRARRFFANSSVRRSLLIDAAAVLIFVPLAVSTSLALMRLFAGKVGGASQLEWHHYLLVAALASLVLVPAFRLAYSCHQYRRRLRRMAAADLLSPTNADPRLKLPSAGAAAVDAAAAVGAGGKGKKHDYTTKSKRIEAADAARAMEYREFACLVAKQQRIELSRRDVSAVDAGDLSCHRPDISMAAYNC
ncbi:hypothetical protein BOX15_Mlig015262g3 [Macrostomum lignano]|uniref:Uncharacterized protein n=1 Tax=Macrostomum lignano TaxID=282301 RepID=A0A267FVA3_9PLAT|nr:hypothetical protein BOX15_Mlig015262g3 [Macrostomum lignano]